LKPIRAEAAASILERAAIRLRQAREDRLRNENAHPPFDLRTLREQFSEPLPCYCAAVGVEDLTSKTTSGSEAPEFVPDLRFVRSTTKNESIYVFNFQGGAPLDLLVANQGVWRLGFGPVCSNLDMISTSLEGAREALTASSFYPAEQVFSLTPVKDTAITGIASDLIDALDTGMIIMAEEFFDRLPAVMRRERLMPWDARQLRDRVLRRVTGCFKNAAAGTDTLTTTLEGFCEGLRFQVLRTICPEAQQAFAAAGTSERMHSMLLFVHRHIATRLTLRELSKVFNFHPNYGCELFKRYTGMRFSEYIVRMKLWHARHLLARTDKPVAVVAEDVGYDYYHFNKLFKKHEGVTPRNYRASHMV
jgi:AraC-like DNA-binding protein